MMPSNNQSPEPERETEENSQSLTGPKKGKRLKVEDKRAEFEKITRQTPGDLDEECAFIQGKIEMVLSDANLSDLEKKQAIEELKRKLHNP